MTAVTPESRKNFIEKFVAHVKSKGITLPDDKLTEAAELSLNLNPMGAIVMGAVACADMWVMTTAHDRK